MASPDVRPSAADPTRESDFSPGSRSVRPSTAPVIASGSDQRGEPPIIQMLIVLGRNLGKRGTRDQLPEACLNGRIVSDDAVSRVISQVRSLARLSNPPAFRLETLPKVGIRLVAHGTLPQPPPLTRFVPATLPPTSWEGVSLASIRYRIFTACAVLGLLSLDGAAWWVTIGGTDADMPPPLFAIAAFDNPSADPLVSLLAHCLQAETVKSLGKWGGPRK